MENDAVRTALSRARYNETVSIEISQHHDQQNNGTEQQQQAQPQPQTISLVPCLDESTGGIQFNNLLAFYGADNDDNDNNHNNNNNDEIRIRARRELQTKSRWFFPMLNDDRRNQLYQQAIAAACREVMERRRQMRHTNDDDDDNIIRVLDIGSGTGLLAILAAQQLQTLVNDNKKDDNNNSNNNIFQIHVTSIEMSSPLASVARQTVRDNGLSDVITIVEGHSANWEPPPQQQPVVAFDLCTSELLEDGLLGEGWLPTLRDLRQRHWIDAHHTVIVPQRATVYGQVVVAANDGDGDWLATLLGSQQQPQRVVSLCLDESQTTPMLHAVDAVLPVHARHLLNDSRIGIAGLRAVSDPVQLLECSVVSGDIPTHDQRTVSVPIASTTTATDAQQKQQPQQYGVLVWWDLELYPGINVYSTSPILDSSDADGPSSLSCWQDHWHPLSK